MDIRERIKAFWSGQCPEQIPYTTYYMPSMGFPQWYDKETAPKAVVELGDGDPAWKELYEAGLGVVVHVGTTKEKPNNVEHIQESFEEDGQVINRRIMRTPVGEIYTDAAQGWVQKYWLKTPEDYKVMTYIVENTEIEENYDSFINTDEKMAPYQIPLVALGRTPMQVILVDYTGLENFSYHLFECEKEMKDLYQALLGQFRKKVQLVSEGPGHFVSVLENFTAETMGPMRFEEFHMPVYEQLFPILQKAGKVIGTHYDGKLRSCSELVKKAPIDIIESLTSPPEGDMSISECRSLWPDKKFWVNINVSNYNLPPDDLRAYIYKTIEEGAVDGKGLAFEVSEDLPENWKESMKVVLEALNEANV